MATVPETLSSGFQESSPAPYPNHMTRYSCTGGRLPFFLSRCLKICFTNRLYKVVDFNQCVGILPLRMALRSPTWKTSWCGTHSDNSRRIARVPLHPMTRNGPIVWAAILRVDQPLTGLVDKEALGQLQ